MSLPNRLGWSFVASPRELQFLGAGIVLGALAILIARTIPWVDMTGVVFSGVVGATIAFGVLAMARSNSN